MSLSNVNAIRQGFAEEAVNTNHTGFHVLNCANAIWTVRCRAPIFLPVEWAENDKSENILESSYIW